MSESNGTRSNNADAIANYVYFLRNDPAAFKPAVMDYIRKFLILQIPPNALFVRCETEGRCVKNRDIRAVTQTVPARQVHRVSTGVSALFGIYDRSDPPKAQALAHELLGVDPKDNALLADVAYADSMAKAEQKVKDHKPADALAILQTVKSPFPRQFSMDRKDLLEARALDLENRKQDAYSSLLAIYVKHPTDEIRTAVDEYGAKLGKKKQEVEAAFGRQLK